MSNDLEQNDIAGPSTPRKDPVISTDHEDDEFGEDIALDEDLETVLLAAESQVLTTSAGSTDVTNETEKPVAHSASGGDVDMEDLFPRSPFLEFRKKGWLSVSDLVGTVWCEVQYDYRLRTLPYLPPSQRPDLITSKAGAEISVDKAKVEGKERILRRGEKIHKRLEREIHPEEIVVTATTREDVWGLRFLNMFSALEALLTLGKCRELPVVGFVRGILIMGVIDEITRKPVDPTPTPPETRSARHTQTSLTNFFSPTKSRPVQAEPKPRTHKLYVRDSKTRASGTLPREGDTLAGRLQVMLYKELLDALLLSVMHSLSGSNENAILPTALPFSWPVLFAHLNLNPEEPFSEDFVGQSRAVVLGNGLRFGAGEARALTEMVRVWEGYVLALGLGAPSLTPSSSKKGSESEKLGRTEERLELVYRRAGPAKKERKGKRRKDKEKAPEMVEKANAEEVEDEEELIRMAIEESLISTTTLKTVVWDADDDEKEEDELAWAVEMSLGAGDVGAEESGDQVVLRASQRIKTAASTQEPAFSSQLGTLPRPVVPDDDSEPEPGKPGTSSGSIIGKHRFNHSPRLLAAHLDSVLAWWLGKRDAIGVGIEETRRCGWCEFEEGCEWRAAKAEEAVSRMRARR